MGACFFDGSCASGTVATVSGFFGAYCDLPAGLFVSSHSWPCRFSMKLLSHFTGSVVQAPSRPLVIVSPPLPLPWVFFQPRPCSSMPAPSGSGPTVSSGAAPCALPKVCPPAMRATVSSSFIAMRLNVWRMNFAARPGSGLPFGPSGFT